MSGRRPAKATIRSGHRELYPDRRLRDRAAPPDDFQGTAAINLTGNELGNEIWGNYGDNVINGGAGADHMSGWKGNDTYIVDNAGDSVFENGDIYSTPENESEGFDTVLT